MPDVVYGKTIKVGATEEDKEAVREDLAGQARRLDAARPARDFTDRDERAELAALRQRYPEGM